MKRRVLKPWVEKGLAAIGVVLFVLLISVNDFTLKGLFLMVCGWVLLIKIISILATYGKNGKKFFDHVC